MKVERMAQFVGLAFARRFDGKAGSKTFDGLTYLELILLNIEWLARVSRDRAGRKSRTYKIGDHDLSLAARGSSRDSRCGLVGLGLPGGLSYASDRGFGGTTSARAAGATAATGVAAGGLENVIERGVELVGHCGGCRLVYDGS